MSVDHAREFFAAHDGLIYFYETGHWWMVECQEVEPTPERPCGLKYSLAFFGPDDCCVVRFDNSHAVKVRGKPNPTAYDHWHRIDDRERPVPYEFTSVERLLDDFMEAVDRHLPPNLRSS